MYCLAADLALDSKSKQHNICYNYLIDHMRHSLCLRYFIVNIFIELSLKLSLNFCCKIYLIMSQLPGKQIDNYFFVAKYLLARSNCLEHKRPINYRNIDSQ